MEYEEYIKSVMENSNLETQEKEYNQSVWNMVLDNCEILGYPEEQLNESAEEYYVSYKEKYKSEAWDAGMTYQEYLKDMGYADDQALKDECIKKAKTELEYIMIGVEIAKKEDIIVTEEIYMTWAQTLAENSGYSNVALLEAEYGTDYIMENVVFEVVSLWLYENNILVERVW
jgi:FKBP-type peptidyl-prolyl cis-trans isomerase (trigger factor)